jgi:hypothetical protein
MPELAWNNTGRIARQVPVYKSPETLEFIGRADGADDTTLRSKQQKLHGPTVRKSVLSRKADHF